MEIFTVKLLLGGIGFKPGGKRFRRNWGRNFFLRNFPVPITWTHFEFHYPWNFPLGQEKVPKGLPEPGRAFGTLDSGTVKEGSQIFQPLVGTLRIPP